MISTKAFTASFALSILVHVLLVYGLMGRAFLPGSPDAVAGRTFQVRLVEITVQNGTEEEQQQPEEEPEDTPDHPENNEEHALRFVNPNQPKPVEVIAVPDAPRPSPPPLEAPAPRPQDPVPQPFEVLSAPSAEADAYWDAVRVAIAREVRYPTAQRNRMKEGVIMLRIVIDASGRLVKVDVLPPRGDRALTRAALQAVQRAAPFEPPASHGMSPGQRTAELPIRFQIRR